jgi:hypothetical protein
MMPPRPMQAIEAEAASAIDIARWLLGRGRWTSQGRRRPGPPPRSASSSSRPSGSPLLDLGPSDEGGARDLVRQEHRRRGRARPMRLVGRAAGAWVETAERLRAAHAGDHPRPDMAGTYAHVAAKTAGAGLRRRSSGPAS